MKRILSLFLCVFTMSTAAFANFQSTVMNYENSQSNRQQVNVVHDKHEYIKKGRYTYRVNKNGDLLGYYKTTANGKKITAYDEDGDITRSYRMSPSGKMIIYNSKGKRIN